MAHLINKDALVAEIERRKNICQGVARAMEDKQFTHQYYNGKTEAYSEALEFINDLEVKEVGLEKEFDNYMDFCDGYVKNRAAFTNEDKAFELAKHFFELGIKAQKGELL